MNRLKSDDNETLDRLSELPESLILHILSFLAMEDVVRTTLLSKRWKYLWITLPCLNFYAIKGCSVRTRSFVNRALILWRGAEIRKFKLSFKNGFDSLSYGDMDLWVLFAKERKVEELYIHLPFDCSRPSDNNPVYWLPQSLYECSSIRKLSLFCCNLQIRGNVQWDQLKILKMCGFRLTEDVINQVVSGTPRLEIFLLIFVGSHRSLSFQSNSLKRLSISSTEYDPSVYTVLTIRAPNLEALEILGAPFSECLLTGISSLTEANLDLWDKWAADVGEPLSQILPTIQHVETLKLSACCFKMLGVMKGKDSFSPLLNVKLLRIGSRPIEPNKIVGLLANFPKLRMLVIDWKFDARKQDIGDLLMFDAENYIESESNILNSFLLQLRTVEITWYSYEASIFQFVEHLLKHATMIEKMVIQKQGKTMVESEEMFLAAQKVVSLQRSFPTVELVFCKQ